MLNTKKKTTAFYALCMGFFMVILDTTIVNVTLPSIANYFHTTLTHLQWVIGGYSLTFAGLLLFAGSLTDRFGGKIIFQTGLIAFAITSLGCAVSPSINLLIFFRLLQGASGALLLPPSLALINIIYQEKEQRAKAIGIWAALGGVACASGPFLGGLITHLISWRAIFSINIIIGLANFFLISRCVDSVKGIVNKIKFDFVGQATGFIAISLLAYALIEASIYSWKNPIIIVCIITSLLAFIIFLIAEARTNHPIVPLNLFRNKMTSTGLLVTMILNLSFYGSLFTMPFYFEHSRHYTVLTTGLALLPLPGLAVMGSYLGGKCTGKFGPAKIMFIGLSMAAVGFLALLTIGETTPNYIWLAIPFLVIGFGVSFTTPAMTFAAIHAVEEKRQGIAAGVLNMIRQVGSLIGVAIFGTIINTSKTLVSGMHTTFLIAGTLFLVTAFLSLLVMR